MQEALAAFEQEPLRKKPAVKPPAAKASASITRPARTTSAAGKARERSMTPIDIVDDDDFGEVQAAPKAKPPNGKRKAPNVHDEVVVIDDDDDDFGQEYTDWPSAFSGGGNNDPNCWI